MCPRDGARAPAREERACEAPRVEGFELGGLLGAGGAGSVWRARFGGRTVALKVAHADDAAARARFEREAAALRAIGPPHTAELVASGVQHGTPWLAMSVLEGETLATRLARVGALPIDEAIATVRAIAAAVDAVHAAGLVHRDLKPENVVVDAAATLLDFGLSIEVSDAAPRASDVTLDRAHVGTVAYSPPEQHADAARVDARADVYALGAMAFEMLTGRPPFVGAAGEVALAHASARPPSLGALRAEAAPFAAAIARALEKSPSRRYARASELATALEGAVATAPVAETTRAPAAPKSVALLGVRGAAPLDALATAVAPFGGVVARTFGDLRVVAFPAARALERGVRAAVLAAHRVRDLAPASAVVHVAEVRVRDATRRLLAGAALDRPETWCVGGDAITLTPEASAHAPRVESAEPAAPAALMGRDALVADVATAARRAIATRRALLVTLLGEPGMGKSALLGAIGDALADLEPTALNDADAIAQGVFAQGVFALDDAHFADAALLDAIERATSEAAPVVVIAAALPSLRARRPSWGARADVVREIAVPPLDADASRALLAACMRPVESMPEPLVARLVRDAEGCPQSIVDVARAIHRSGAVRRDAGGEGWFLAADELQFVDRVPPSQALARVACAGLPPSVLAIAGVAAALDDALSRDTLAATSRELGDAAAFDVGVAVERLVRAGVLVEDDGLRFASSALRRAVAAMTAPDLRVPIDAAIHRVFSTVPSERARAARHALAAGDADAARALFTALAEAALHAHRHADAESHATAALVAATAPDARRALLALRARARYRLQRYADAVEDLGAALALAPSDAREVADLELDLATARDWMHDVDGAAAATERARPFVERAGDARLGARLATAEARTTWRRGDHAAAAAALAAAAAAARAAGDAETEIIAGLMLGSALVYTGRLDEAERAYARVVDECERTHDRFHLAVACSNRLALWAKLRRADRARDDLSRALDVARELGNVQLERIASHNLAELLYYRGDLDAALRLAERSRALQLRFFSAHPIANDALLVARILAARGERGDEARAMLAWNEANVPPASFTPSARMLARMVSLMLDGRRDEWEEISAEAARVALIDEHAEVLYAATLAATRSDDPALARARADAAAAALATAPDWLARIDALLSPR